MKIYLSSTFEDLRDYRAAVDRVLRQMGHDVIGMEQYVAEQSTPLERSTDDVRSADVYVVLVAWRYGYIPTHPDNSERHSITELEYTAAVGAHKTILAFLLDPQAPWPPNWIDAVTQASGADILRFRSLVGTKYLAGIFRTPDHLASLAATAIARQGIKKQIVERTLTLEPVADFMVAFAQGSTGVDNPTAPGSIQEMVTNPGNQAAPALRIDMGSTIWWSTRLYLLAALIQSLTSVRQFLFAGAGGHFAAMASPSAVREGLCSSFQELAEFDSELRQGEISKDIEREIRRTLDLWNQKIQPREPTLKTGVTAAVLFCANGWVKKAGGSVYRSSRRHRPDDGPRPATGRFAASRCPDGRSARPPRLAIFPSSQCPFASGRRPRRLRSRIGPRMGAHRTTTNPDYLSHGYASV